MKLELKHVASYLPYGLKVASGDWYDEDDKLSNIGDMVFNYDQYKPNDISIQQLYGSDDGIFEVHGVLRKKAKPILRPLSDLVKEIDGIVHARELGKLAISIQRPERLLVVEGGLPDIEYRIITKPFGKVLKVRNGQTWLVYLSLDEPFRCHHYVVQYLFQHHFDVYGLIEEGLAIDINTIENV